MNILLKYRTISDNEKSNWNDFISNSPNGDLLQSFEWGEVKRKDNWIPIKLVVEDESKIRGAILILKHKIPFVNLSIFYAPRGPVLDYEDHDAFDTLLDAIKNTAFIHKAIYIQIEPRAPIENTRFSDYLKSKGFVNLKKKSIFRLGRARDIARVNIANSLDDILMSFHSKLRNSIRSAERKGIETIFGDSIDDLKIFYNLIEDTGFRQKFPVRNFGYFRELWNNFLPSDIGKILLARYEDQIIAGCFVFIFGQVCWYMYGASSDLHRNLNAPHLLHWKAIELAKTRGCQYYDLAGCLRTPLSPDNPGYGIQKFKMRFNPELYTFPEHYYIFRPSLYHLWVFGENLLGRLGNIYLKYHKPMKRVLGLFTSKSP